MSTRARLALGWALAIAAMLAFAALGRWQLSRMHEKQAMLDRVHAVLATRAPLALEAAADPARARDYDWAAGDGRFADAPPVLLDNQSRDERPGVRAYRLFQPERGPALLVELGWLPLPGDRRMPGVPALPGRQRIAGLLLPPPSHGLAAAVAEAQADGTIVATSLDAAGLARLLGRRTLPARQLRLDPAIRIGYPRDLDVMPNTLPPQRHLGYAVQWFALSAAVLATALVLTLRRRRPPPDSPASRTRPPSTDA